MRLFICICSHRDTGRLCPSASYTATICPCDQLGIRNPSWDYLFGSPCLTCLVYTSTVPASTEKVYPGIVFTVWGQMSLPPAFSETLALNQPLAMMHIFTCAAAVSYLFPAMNWKFVSILILDSLLAIEPCLTTTVIVHIPTEVKANCFYMKTLPTGQVNCVISEVRKATGRIFYSPQHMHSSGKASWSLFLDK